MSNLDTYIKSKPEKSMQAWADDFGISRPYLYDLVNGTRLPSIEVAVRIERGTGGTVPVVTWPNLAAVLRAAGGEL
jgi:plasmid maintenance system antidote protein VapI